MLHDLCRSGGDRHREHPAAQRVARGPSAADRDRRCVARSSARHPASWGRYSRKCWRMPRAFARPVSAPWHCAKVTDSDASPCITRRPSLPNSTKGDHTAPGGSSTLDRLMRTKQLVHLPVEDPDTPLAKYAGARTVLTVPLLKEDELIGVWHLSPEVRPFTDKQIELVQELRRPGRDRHREHAAAQRAGAHREFAAAADRDRRGAEVISSSPGELEPVFETMLANAVRICEAKFGIDVFL